MQLVDVAAITGLRILDVRIAGVGAWHELRATPACLPSPLQADVRAGYSAYLAGEVAAALKAKARQAEFRVSKKRATVLCAGTGSREVRLTYLGRAEPWQVTYRLALTTADGPAAAGAAALGTSSRPPAIALHAFATVANVSSEDWAGVELSLVSGEVQARRGEAGGRRRGGDSIGNVCPQPKRRCCKMRRRRRRPWRRSSSSSRASARTARWLWGA